jgi:hypothetical protein
VCFCKVHKEFVKTSEIADHCDSKGCPQSSFAKSQKVRPDKSFWFEGHQVITDETNIGLLTASNVNSTSILKPLERREREKYTRYKSAVEKDGHTFLCVGSTPNGFLNNDTQYLCKLIAKHSAIKGDSIRAVENEYRRHICIATATALINAEEEHGASHHKSEELKYPNWLDTAIAKATLRADSDDPQENSPETHQTFSESPNSRASTRLSISRDRSVSNSSNYDDNTADFTSNRTYYKLASDTARAKTSQQGVSDDAQQQSEIL